jgi:hypothetical protein
MAGFVSERVAGFILECLAGFVGILTHDPWASSGILIAAIRGTLRSSVLLNLRV